MVEVLVNTAKTDARKLCKLDVINFVEVKERGAPQERDQDRSPQCNIDKTVSPHVLRHSAAVCMAEDGVDMEVIRQFLGHSDIETTRRIDARFSAMFLRDAADALELDDL